MSIFTSCLSPEEKIKEDIEYKTEAFRNSDSDYFVQDSKVYIYNTANNINYLANENIRNLAISYANNLGRAEYNRKQAQKYRTSTKFDKDYNPNWFEEAKIAEKTAEEHQRYARAQDGVGDEGLYARVVADSLHDVARISCLEESERQTHQLSQELMDEGDADLRSTLQREPAT